MKIYPALDKNQKYIENLFDSDDLETTEISVGGKNAALFFLTDIVDKDKIGDLIIRPFSEYSGDATAEDLLLTVLCPEKETAETLTDISNKIVEGYTALLIDGEEKALIFGIKKFDKRAVVEPPTSTVIKGPREGFVESLPVNVSLMRRKLKTPDLKFKSVKVGKYSNTPVMLCYVKGIADESIVKTLVNRLKKIDTDAVLDSSIVAKFINEHKTSIFRQVGNAEKPDILAAKILEGRVAIFVDGSPVAITVPYILLEDFQSPGDYYSQPYNATIARLIRFFSVATSILLPAFFVASELFHLQLIPLSFLLTIVNSIKGIPLSPSYEMFFTLLIFEILNEASVRMPKSVGMVVSIVGGLVLGETAVTAGIISAPTLMIVAFSGICLYTVPELERTFSLIRLLLLLVGGSVGIYGMLASLLFLMVYSVSFESFGAPLIAPFSPLIKSDLKDSFYKGFLTQSNKRPLSFGNKNKTRLSAPKEKND